MSLMHSKASGGACSGMMIAVGVEVGRCVLGCGNPRKVQVNLTKCSSLKFLRRLQLNTMFIFDRAWKLMTSDLVSDPESGST